MALRVLVAEDCPVVQHAVRDVLERAGVTVLAFVADGAEAVRESASLHPDVVILDYSMPAMNGVEAAREIRRTNADAAIVILTACTSEYHIAAALSAGVRGIVLKADAGDDLVRAIHDVGLGGTFVSPRASRALYEPYLPIAES